MSDPAVELARRAIEGGLIDDLIDRWNRTCATKADERRAIDAIRSRLNATVGLRRVGPVARDVGRRAAAIDPDLSGFSIRAACEGRDWRRCRETRLARRQLAKVTSFGFPGMGPAHVDCRSTLVNYPKGDAEAASKVWGAILGREP